MKIIVAISCILLGITAFICMIYGLTKAIYKKDCSKEELKSYYAIVFVGVVGIIVLTIGYMTFFR